MNKILYTLNLLLLILVIGLNIVWLQRFSLVNVWHALYLFLLFIFVISNVRDIKEKRKIMKNNRYNFLCIIMFFLMILVFLRALYGSSFICNDLTLMKQLDDLMQNIYGSNLVSDAALMPYFYITQNMWIFVGLTILTFIYRLINGNYLNFSLKNGAVK